MSRLAGATSLSRPQIVAYELSSLEQSRLLDDVAHLVWQAWGEHSLLGTLADEARWAAFVLHDRIAVHAVREAGVSKHRLAMGALSAEEATFTRPNQLRACAPDDAHRGRARIAAALSRVRAALVGMCAGYEGVCAHTHPLMTAFRAALSAVATLRREIEGERRDPREPRPAMQPRIVKSTRTPRASALLLLWGAEHRSRRRVKLAR